MPTEISIAGAGSVLLPAGGLARLTRYVGLRSASWRSQADLATSIAIPTKMSLRGGHNFFLAASCFG